MDAAHIRRFADSGDNDPRNGLTLCKNAHWMFDEGLWTLADDEKFAEARPGGCCSPRTAVGGLRTCPATRRSGPTRPTSTGIAGKCSQ